MSPSEPTPQRGAFAYEEERPSGVYRRPRYAGPRAIEAATQLTEIVGGPVAILLLPARVAPDAPVAPSGIDVDEHGFSVSLRLYAWLSEVEHPSRVAVPPYVADLFPAEEAIVLPLRAFSVSPLRVRRVGLVALEARSLRSCAFPVLREALSVIAQRVEDAT
jgi:hypothetical protein